MFLNWKHVVKTEVKVHTITIDWQNHQPVNMFDVYGSKLDLSPYPLTLTSEGLVPDPKCFISSWW